MNPELQKIQQKIKQIKEKISRAKELHLLSELVKKL